MKDESRESYNSLVKPPQTLSEIHFQKPRQKIHENAVPDNQS
jgi:hypothetical protein